MSVPWIYIEYRPCSKNKPRGLPNNWIQTAWSFFTLCQTAEVFEQLQRQPGRGQICTKTLLCIPESNMLIHSKHDNNTFWYLPPWAVSGEACLIRSSRFCYYCEDKYMKRYVPNCKHRLDITANAEALLHHFVHLSNAHSFCWVPKRGSMSISEAPEHQYIQAHADVSHLSGGDGDRNWNNRNKSRAIRIKPNKKLWENQQTAGMHPIVWSL